MSLSSQVSSVGWRWYLFLILSLSVLLVVYGPTALLLFLVGVLGYLIYHKPEIGLYVLVILSPMIGLEFYASWFLPESTLFQYQWPGWIQSFYAPMVDIWALFCLCIWGGRLVSTYLRGERQTIVLPGVWLYALFLCSAVLSILHLSGDMMVSSIGYFLRFLCFVYLGYVVLGVNTITSKTILMRALTTYVWVCAGVACMGLISFVMGGYGGSPFHRAVPLSVFGLDLFNYPRHLLSGHILLAEVCTTAIPIAIYLAYRATNRGIQRLYYGVTFVLVSASILTFSRAGWLTLIVQALMYIVFFYRDIQWRRYISLIVLGVLMSIPAVMYMYLFLQSSIVSSSNSARLALAEVGWYFFTTQPIFGQGVGMFTVLLQDVMYFTSQFGDAIDAHGIFHKVSAEQGIVGVVTFSMFVGYIIVSIYRRMKHAFYTVEARMVAFLSLFLVISPLFFQLFNTQYYSARLWVPFMLALAMNLLFRHDTSRTTVYISFVPTKAKAIRTDII